MVTDFVDVDYFEVTDVIFLCIVVIIWSVLIVYINYRQFLAVNININKIKLLLGTPSFFDYIFIT